MLHSKIKVIKNKENISLGMSLKIGQLIYPSTAMACFMFFYSISIPYNLTKSVT